MDSSFFRNLELLARKVFLTLKYEGTSSLLSKLVKNKAFLGNDYQRWISDNEPKKGELKTIERKIQEFEFKPKFSIFLEMDHIDKDDFGAVLESLEDQIYENWELIIKSNLTKLAKERPSDPRIKFVSRKPEFEGDFVLFLDVAGQLAPFALYELVKAFNQDSRVDLIYFDEDRRSKDGKRFEPLFKPDWAPEFFESFNYIKKAFAVSRGLLTEIGGVDYKKNYDLLFKITEKSKRIIHIAKILYHAPNHAPSSIEESESESIKVLDEHFKRVGIKARAEDTGYDGVLRPHFEIKGNPKVTIVIPTKDAVSQLRVCINSILEKTRYENYEILLINNQSREQETLVFFDQVFDGKKIKVFEYDKPFNFAGLNNFAAEKSKSEFLLFLNNDTEVINSDWLDSLLEPAQKKEVGIVGAKLFYPSGRIQHAGIIIGFGEVAGHAFTLYPKDSSGYLNRLVAIQNYLAITAACMLVKRKLFEEVGGFDEKL